MLNLESYTKIDENAKIAGVALIPRISRNHNLYTKEELKRFNGVTVPLNWEHDAEKVIGQATFHYNAESETLFYEGEITDSSASLLAKNRILYTSIEATPQSIQQVCNGQTDCFHMPYGLRPEGLALTETPGVPETSVSIIENYILKECKYDEELEKKYAGDKTKSFMSEENKSPESLEDWIHALKEIGVFEVLGLEYCAGCGKVKKNEKQ